MKVKKTEGTEKKSSTGKSSISFQVITIVVIMAMALLFFFWHQKNFRAVTENEDVNNPLTEEISIPEQVVSMDVTEDAQVPIPAVASSTTASLPSPSAPDDDLKDILPGSAEVAMIKSETTASLPQEDPVGSVDSTSATCTESVQTIREFYAHLDKQDYLKQYNLGAQSEAHFTTLVQKLLENPPVVSGETDDLYTILQNTAHFFRIIGKNNILALKAILDRERNQFENVLAQFYTLLHIPSCPEQNFNLEVSPSPLYDYAGFFLNTMGGRLYLFRRDSMSRMVVSYYAIMLIDQANKNAGNQHGIELDSAIDQLIDEIESTTNTLQLKKIYLDRLYTLKEEYQ